MIAEWSRLHDLVCVAIPWVVLAYVYLHRRA